MQTADRGEGKPRGLAPGTIKTRLQDVRTVMRAAVRDKLIVSDPTEDVTIPRQRRAEAAMEIPEPAQVRALLDHATVPWMRLFIALAAFAGLRLGEAAAVRRRDVNFLGRILQVTYQAQRGPGGAVLITPPKYGSERPIALADGLLQLLSIHVKDMPESPEGWLFLGEGEDRSAAPEHCGLLVAQDVPPGRRHRTRKAANSMIDEVLADSPRTGRALKAV